MIPSSPRRTWTFLLLSSLAFFMPDFVVPVAWEKQSTYLLLSSLYQGALVIAGFWYGPAICRALVVKEVIAGPLRQTLDRAVAELGRSDGHAQVNELPLTLAEYPIPFIVTTGLLPGRTQVFLSSALAERIGNNGLRFLLARALAHGEWSQRLAALLPVLALTVMLTQTPASFNEWLELALCLVGWLVMHWFFELRADRQAARIMGFGAQEGLHEMLRATGSPLGWLSAQPPIRWRLRMVRGD
jgi:Zn-dependent protease with chaperone function